MNKLQLIEDIKKHSFNYFFFFLVFKVMKSL